VTAAYGGDHLNNTFGAQHAMQQRHLRLRHGFPVCLAPGGDIADLHVHGAWWPRRPPAPGRDRSCRACWATGPWFAGGDPAARARSVARVHHGPGV